MANINHYMVEGVGIFPLIVDDIVFQNISSYSTGDLVTISRPPVGEPQANYTELYRNLDNLVGISNLMPTILYDNVLPFDDDFLFLLNNTYNFYQLFSTSGQSTSFEYTDFDVEGGENRIVGIGKKYLSTVANPYTQMRSRLSYNNNIFESIDTNYPFGALQPYSVGGDKHSYNTSWFLISNSTMTEFKGLEIAVQPTKARINRSIKVYGLSDNTFLNSFFTNLDPYVPPEPVPEDTDPYKDGGNSAPGGGVGHFSRTGDNIGIPNLPTLSAVDAGFITLFNPSASDLANLAGYMWTGAFDMDTFKKIFANPMECILGMSIVPVNIPTSGSATVKVGNISTGISMPKVSTQYVSVDCGTLVINKYWDAYLDYDPYTKCEIYLPYIGIHQLAVDDIMGKDVKVVYHVDILSGACTAFIKCDNSVLYSFNGQCSCSIPITGNDWTNVINGVLGIAGSIGALVASGGLTAPLTGAGVAKGISAIASSAQTVNSSKPQVERSGSLSGMGGMLGIQTPYMIITWPKQCLPKYQNKFSGYPSFITVSLGEIVGYNEIAEIHLEYIHATQQEIEEIEKLLKEGVIF